MFQRLPALVGQRALAFVTTTSKMRYPELIAVDLSCAWRTSRTY
jgi:hypothetical protein